jgi:asparagine synthase (glutamine-hydrolysing)
MCGLNVLFNDDEESMLKMNGRLAHRGRRSAVRRYWKSVYLGHVRLPIQGLNPCYDHPMSYKKYDAAMVGEVLNFRDFDQRAATDTSVVLQRWNEGGVESFLYYDGFWSVVIMDDDERLVHVVVDPLAKKPLYVKTSHPRAISSEIYPLLELGPTKFDGLYFSAVSKWGYFVGERTPFEDIHRVPPGTHTVFDRTGRIKSCRYYWDWKNVPGRRPARPENVLALVTRAVRNRLVSDVPVSVLTSGGLDSSIVYELVKEQKSDVSAFYVDNDEMEYVEKLTDASSIRLVSCNLPVDVKEALYANQVPVDLGSMIPQYVLGRTVREYDFDVALSGDGADELFGGYGRAQKYDSQMSDVFQELPFYHLPRLDHLMMASTVELRCPFLSYALIATMMTAPWEARKKKELLKQAFGGVVHADILAREKKALRIEAVERAPLEWRLDLIKDYREMIQSKWEVFNER